MTQTLVSSIPGIFNALLSLVQAAAATQAPPVQVFPFEVGQYEPGSYITVHDIRGPRYEWENIGVFTQKELYEVAGVVTVFSGSSVTPGSTVTTDVMGQCFSLLQSCVMAPVMSNRTMPLLGTTGPSPYLMLPDTDFVYESEPGMLGGRPAGWVGTLRWSFHFEALLTPA